MSSVKSNQCVVRHGETFIHDWPVEAMFGRLKGESERIVRRSLEPACGWGNFVTRLTASQLTMVERRHVCEAVEVV